VVSWCRKGILRIRGNLPFEEEGTIMDKLLSFNNG
jgi:hypothetical protein